MTAKSGLGSNASLTITTTSLQVPFFNNDLVIEKEYFFINGNGNATTFFDNASNYIRVIFTWHT